MTTPIKYLLATALVCVAHTAAAQDMRRCTVIDALPYTITAPGNYCLVGSLKTDRADGSIHINASNVVLDCKGRALIHTVDGTRTPAISAGGTSPVTDVTVHGCKIVNYGTGISFGPRSQRITIADNDIVHSRWDGIVLWGSDSSIVDNRVMHSKYAALQDYTRSITVTAFDTGIPSVNNLISRNQISGASESLRIWGIRVDFSDDAIVSDNTISDLQARAGGSAIAIQIGGFNAQVIDNVISRRSTPVTGINGTPSLCTRNIAIGTGSNPFAACVSTVNDLWLP